MKDEKNFKNLELGCWYLRRDGSIIQIKNIQNTISYPLYLSCGAGSYFRDGRYSSPSLEEMDECPLDIMAKIEQLNVVPCKRKKRVRIERWVNIYCTAGAIFEEMFLSATLANYNAENKNRLDCVPFVWEGEIEE